jgi:hypothetical protein
MIIRLCLLFLEELQNFYSTDASRLEYLRKGVLFVLSESLLLKQRPTLCLLGKPLLVAQFISDLDLNLSIRKTISKGLHPSIDQYSTDLVFRRSLIEYFLENLKECHFPESSSGTRESLLGRLRSNINDIKIEELLEQTIGLVRNALISLRGFTL